MKKYIKCDSNLDSNEIDEFVKSVKNAMREAEIDEKSILDEEDYEDEDDYKQSVSYYEGKYTGLQKALEILYKFTGKWYL